MIITQDESWKNECVDFIENWLFSWVEKQTNKQTKQQKKHRLIY